MKNYSLEQDVFSITQFDQKPPFSSFLPGLTGVKGIPLWVFYTNRGQGINSFGIHNKSNAIMEFNPANTAYENTGLKGFRTFVRTGDAYFEPFSSYGEETERDFHIKKNSFSIVENNKTRKINTKVNYFVLPNESIGALVRQVSVTNTGNSTQKLEIVDGLPKIIPYGIQNGGYKEMSNLLKSWTEIKNIDRNAPYYTMRASSDDSAEVAGVEGGYFYLTVKDGDICPVIYDTDVLFGYDTSLQNPVVFREGALAEVESRSQCFANKVPCGFTAIKAELAPGESVEFTTYTGFAGSTEQINAKLPDFLADGYAGRKAAEADELMETFVQDVTTHTASGQFDQYIEQCYLDNFLRGGYPFVFEKDGRKAVVHLFSRKHGDPERDYNFFSIAGEYYSQGNGNFRDVCQNRRNDVFFKKEVGDFNIKNFFSLIQIDGYNPLEIRPSTFSVREECREAAAGLIAAGVEGKTENLMKVLSQSFTPGQISNTIAREQLIVRTDEDEMINTLLSYCEQNMEAGFGEGYWSDHWDYVLDLVDNYLMIYPEKREELLCGDDGYRFYDSAEVIQPRSETYVISHGKVRQYGSLLPDKEKKARPGFRDGGTNWLKTEDGHYVTTTLFGKMLSLALNKFMLLDPYGMGIEMDGGKPGWNDAMNGLPGLFGSSMAETVELKRLLAFLQKELEGRDTLELKLPEEIVRTLRDTAAVRREAKETNMDSFIYWDKIAALKEQFRAKCRFTLSGVTAEVNLPELKTILDDFMDKVETGIQKAFAYGEGILPTYFTYEAVKFEPVLDGTGNPLLSHYGLPKAAVAEFAVQCLPHYLEGPARVLSVMEDKAAAKQMADRLLASGLYDNKLKMYKTSESIENVSMENGRIRAFTAGWLERESVFLHMEYKYFLGLFKAGLYEEYYEAVHNALIPFLDPEMYGRSILENSSFIASSVNPNPDVHGRGFVARLSGSTVELLSMWIQMFTGGKGFTWEDGTLCLRFAPKLPDWLFDENGAASFRFLSTCMVTYVNPGRKATYGENAAAAVRMELVDADGRRTDVTGDTIRAESAEAVRCGKITAVKIYMEA